MAHQSPTDPMAQPDATMALLDAVDYMHDHPTNTVGNHPAHVVEGHHISEMTDQPAYTPDNQPTYAVGAYTPADQPAYAMGAYTPGDQPDYAQGAYTPGDQPDYAMGAYTQGDQPDYSQGAHTQGDQPAYAMGAYTPGDQPDYAQGAHTPGDQPDYAQGAYTPGDQPDYPQGAYTPGDQLAYTPGNQPSHIMGYQNSSMMVDQHQPAYSMGSQPRSTMQIFCDANPALAQIAMARNLDAQSYFGVHNFTVYEQGCAKVIHDRATAPPPGVAATSSPIRNGKGKVWCSICNKAVNDFARHNREQHILDPGMTFYCPHQGCTNKITRDGQITIDDHLATHNDFRNMNGRAGELLERSDKTSVLNKLTVSASRYVAQHRQFQVQASVDNRNHLAQSLINANIAYPDLQTATLPVPLQHGGPDIEAFTKSEAIAHAILVRRTLQTWDVLFDTARSMLP